MLDRSEYFLTEEEERLLLRIARDTLDAWVRWGKRVDVRSYPLTGTLMEKHGAFVTLRIHGELRGCIGHTANREALADSVHDNAINAACHDPRFAPVQPDELRTIHVELSALTPGDTPDTPFKRVHDISEIRIGRDGLYVERPFMRGGLLLPQVAVEQQWDVEQFLRAVCTKAGYPRDAWADGETQLYRFSAQVFGEQEDVS